MFHKIGEISEHSGAVYDISLNFPYLYSASADKIVARWNVETFQQDSFAVKCSTTPYCLAVDFNQNHLWIGLASGDLHVLDLTSKTEIKYFKQHRSGIFTLVYNSFQNQIIAGDSEGNLSIWEANTLELLLFLPLNCSKIRKINLNSAGTQFSVHGLDGKIRIFETTNFNEIVTLEGHQNGACCSIFVNENLFISGGKDGLLKKWNISDEQLITQIPAHHFAIYDLKTIRDGQNFISASRDKTIKIWETETMAFLQKIDFKTAGHKHSVNAVVKITEDTFASCSDDGKIMFWRYQDLLG